MRVNRSERVKHMILRALLVMSVVSASIPACLAQTRKLTDKNRQIVVAFYEQFFNHHDLTAADRYIGDVYVQHNPNVPNGRKALVDGFTRIFAQFPQRHSQIVRVIAEGDMVVLHVHLTKNPEDRGTAVVDIFRLDHGHIVEHWDVQQTIPETSANSNTMF